MKKCIIYLIRSSYEDVVKLQQSLECIEKNLLPFTKDVDLIIFHEKDFEEYKNHISINYPINFQLIEFNIPNYPDEIKNNIPEIWQHPDGYSATMGYRHMGRFFSGEMYKNELIKQYDYYLRLDNDSFIESPLGYDLFDWAVETNCFFGYIPAGVISDHPAIYDGLWEYTQTIYPDKNYGYTGWAFSTNFELGKVSWFLESEYMNYYEKLDATGNFYLKRWGDAIIKYLGVHMFMNSENYLPVYGFQYRHQDVIQNV